MKTLKAIIKAINKINSFVLPLFGVIVVFLTVMIFYDVIARYGFNKPTKFGFDLSNWLDGTAAFLCGGYILLTDEHIRVDLFYNKYPEKVKAIVNIASCVFILLVVAALIAVGLERVTFLYDKGSISSSGFNVHLWIRWLIVPIGGLLLGLQTFVLFIKEMYFIFTAKRIEECE